MVRSVQKAECVLVSILACFVILIFARRRALPTIFPGNVPLTRESSGHLLVGGGISSDDGRYIYEVPRDIPVKGIALLLHGCGHGAIDFWTPSLGCPGCLGLPGELRVTDIALRHGYAVLAVSSVDRDTKCWRPNAQGQGPDYEVVRHSLSQLEAVVTIAFGRRTAAAVSKQLIVFGVSSGGTFASTLPFTSHGENIHGIIYEVARPAPMWRGQLRNSSSPYPPTVFIHMGNRDKGTADYVNNAIAELSGLRVPTLERNVAPKAFTVEYCKAMLPDYSYHCTRLVRALQQGRHLDGDLYLLENPRKSSWRKDVRDLAADLNDSLIPDKSPLSETLNVAYAGHEITSEFVEEAFRWFEMQSTVGASARL